MVRKAWCGVTLWWRHDREVAAKPLAQTVSIGGEVEESSALVADRRSSGMARWSAVALLCLAATCRAVALAS